MIRKQSLKTLLPPDLLKLGFYENYLETAANLKKKNIKIILRKNTMKTQLLLSYEKGETDVLFCSQLGEAFFFFFSLRKHVW